jgi:hypothetical protein
MHFIIIVKASPQSPQAVKKVDRLFNNIAIYAQPAAVVGIAFGDQGFDSASDQRVTQRLAVVAAVSEQLAGLAQRCPDAPRDGRNRIDQGQELFAVVDVGGGENRGQRRTTRVGNQVMLRAGFGPICWIWPRFFPPCTARIDDESTTTREKLIMPTPRMCESNRSWSFWKTPSHCHLRNRFKSVMPEQPISRGKSSHGIPVLSTNNIPARHNRSGLGGWPPLGIGICFGNRSLMSDQSLSSTSAAAMRSPYVAKKVKTEI